MQVHASGEWDLEYVEVKSSWNMECGFSFDADLGFGMGLDCNPNPDFTWITNTGAHDNCCVVLNT